MRHASYLCCMRALLFLLTLAIALLPTAPGHTQAKPPARPAKPAPASNAPKLIKKFDDWTAATHVEAGQTVCYAFTTATSSNPAVTGRGAVNLTVTERPPAGRDAVAITAGFPYAANSSVAVQADAVTMDFYTAQRSAFARDGKAAVQAFMAARQVVAKSPNPKAGTVTDTFSLKGFPAAYAAILKACNVK